MQYLNNAFVQFFELVHHGVAGVIPNKNISYGIAIILVTLIIRIILLPLNIKQTKSSLVMSELQPETKKIQEKYKNDPQRAQQEMMKLYKEKGASPLSGCLPMLIQWPIFIALYYVFNNLHGIDGVHFLWISDLGKRDIFLAILSGLTTYFSGSLMMMSGDSAQAKQSTTMNVGMSIFMVFISWSLKSALVLYWVVNNSIQIAQTLVMKKVDKNKGNIKA
ncbi:protein translocase component YidC [Clostridium carboxidivorans P7]|uniref:60 kDa inner membrane insertion protein n=1 Tax=Clostridium carboxidivorans P7 TaxID=536227 RepID=C6Q087_9CLOT|nr:membrane protein insertase YidC [Clostridium carboxidivorans]AKN33134.1 protein translocase component YidC [Clostridium carboxidivorans P7]EET85099.1 60 kDa inner membrane insertion protein [Clostridium carboxidivorans P7]EFG87935.1 stage III sporulation protein J family protein [Clostridium carboxidivorans P7]